MPEREYQIEGDDGETKGGIAQLNLFYPIHETDEDFRGETLHINLYVNRADRDISPKLRIFRIRQRGPGDDDFDDTEQKWERLGDGDSLTVELNKKTSYEIAADIKRWLASKTDINSGLPLLNFFEEDNAIEPFAAVLKKGIEMGIIKPMPRQGDFCLVTNYIENKGS